MTTASAPGRIMPKFWLRWLPTFIGFIAGGALGSAVAGRLDSVAAALIGGAVAGAVIGAAQYLALRPFLPGSILWIPATAVGQAIGLAIAGPLVKYGTTISDLLIMGLITGAVIGIAQGIVLMRAGINPTLWLGSLPALWAMGWLATWAIGVDVEMQYFNFGAAGAITLTGLTAPLLMHLLGSPANRTAPVLAS